jgi:CheY-like chemotaxis protein
MSTTSPAPPADPSRTGRGGRSDGDDPRTRLERPVADHRPLHILIVEDDLDLLDLAARMLEAEGHLVQRAADGEEGLAAAEAAPVDLLFTDVVLPGISGIELAGRLAAARPDLAVVLTTGQTDPAQLEDIRTTGLPLLRKPYGAAALREAIRAATADQEQRS